MACAPAPDRTGAASLQFVDALHLLSRWWVAPPATAVCGDYVLTHNAGPSPSRRLLQARVALSRLESMLRASATLGSALDEALARARASRAAAAAAAGAGAAGGGAAAAVLPPAASLAVSHSGGGGVPV